MHGPKHTQPLLFFKKKPTHNPPPPGGPSTHPPIQNRQRPLQRRPGWTDRWLTQPPRCGPNPPTLLKTHPMGGAGAHRRGSYRARRWPHSRRGSGRLARHPSAAFQPAHRRGGAAAPAGRGPSWDGGRAPHAIALPPARRLCATGVVQDRLTAWCRTGRGRKGQTRPVHTHHRLVPTTSIAGGFLFGPRSSKNKLWVNRWGHRFPADAPSSRTSCNEANAVQNKNPKPPACQ